MHSTDGFASFFVGGRLPINQGGQVRQLRELLPDCGVELPIHIQDIVEMLPPT